MALYALSDLHLAFSVDKPMDIFGPKWEKHDEKILMNWHEKIKDDDMILIPGDISWSMTGEESKHDLDWIDSLPGKKIIGKGNHDYWWNSINKLNKMYENTKFIQNNFYSYKDIAICGSRGWNCPIDYKFTEHDEKIYNRELIRMRLSLDGAVKAGFKRFIIMMHYPPTVEPYVETEFTKLFKEYGVEKVIYGHIHGPKLAKTINGVYEGIDYILASADYLDFDPKKIED